MQFILSITSLEVKCQGLMKVQCLRCHITFADVWFIPTYH